jgi:hypothetical protein
MMLPVSQGERRFPCGESVLFCVTGGIPVLEGAPYRCPQFSQKTVAGAISVPHREQRRFDACCIS